MSRHGAQRSRGVLLALSVGLVTVLGACSGAGSASTASSGDSGTAPATTPSAPPTPSTPPSTSATPFPPGGERANITDADSGTIYVHLNAIVTVHLAAMPGFRWSQPMAGDAGVLARADAAQTADGGATGTFRPVMPGTTQVTATDDPTCLPGCGRPSRLWQVTVVVTPHPVP